MKLIVYTFMVFLTPLYLYSQEVKFVEVVYGKAYKNYKDITPKSPQLMKNMEYKLICNLTESIFEFNPAMSIDGKRENERFIGRGGGNGIYYKNLKLGKKIWQIEKYGETFIVNEDINQCDWNLMKDEKMIILGYDCYKAIATCSQYSSFDGKEVSYTIEAWYTPDIPLGFGPAGYDGLPGLVLQATRGGSFYFIATELEIHNRKLKINEPNKGKNVTLREFNDFLVEGSNNYMKD